MSNGPKMKSNSLKEIAKYFGVTPRTIQNWVLKGMPRNEDETYNVPDCVVWAQKTGKGISMSSQCKVPGVNVFIEGKKEAEERYEEREEKKERERLLKIQSETPLGNLAQYKLLYEKSRAELKEIEAKNAKADLVPKKEIFEKIALIIQETKKALYQMVKTLPGQMMGLEADQVEELLEKRVFEICERFSTGTIGVQHGLE